MRIFYFDLLFSFSFFSNPIFQLTFTAPIIILDKRKDVLRLFCKHGRSMGNKEVSVAKAP